MIDESIKLAAQSYESRIADMQQDADIVLFIYREDYYNDGSENKNAAELIVAKNRHGETGKIDLQWMGQFTAFLPQDNRHGG